VDEREALNSACNIIFIVLNLVLPGYACLSLLFYPEKGTFLPRVFFAVEKDLFLFTVSRDLTDRWADL
jgi:hypothetical protein